MCCWFALHLIEEARFEREGLGFQKVGAYRQALAMDHTTLRTVPKKDRRSPTCLDHEVASLYRVLYALIVGLWFLVTRKRRVSREVE